MKIGAPYVTFATVFRVFLKKKKFQSPSEFHRDLSLHMGKKAPSLSTIWMAFYGARILPLETILFMRDRYDFELDWQDVLPVRDLSGVQLKQVQLALPGMRELKGRV